MTFRHSLGAIPVLGGPSEPADLVAGYEVTLCLRVEQFHARFIDVHLTNEQARELALALNRFLLSRGNSAPGLTKKETQCE